MIEISPTLAIDEREIQESFVRAEGPGGQNVNKVSTAVQLRFDVVHSPSLPQRVKDRLPCAERLQLESPSGRNHRAGRANRRR